MIAARAIDIATRAARAARLPGARIEVLDKEVRIHHLAFGDGEALASFEALDLAGVPETARWLEAKAKAGAIVVEP